MRGIYTFFDLVYMGTAFLYTSRGPGKMIRKGMPTEVPLFLLEHLPRRHPLGPNMSSCLRSPDIHLTQTGEEETRPVIRQRAMHKLSNWRPNVKPIPFSHVSKTPTFTCPRRQPMPAHSPSFLRVSGGMTRTYMTLFGRISSGDRIKEM